MSLLDWAGAGAEPARAGELLELSGGNPLLALELLTHAGPGPSAAPGRGCRTGQPVLASRLATFSRADELVLAAGALLVPAPMTSSSPRSLRSRRRTCSAFGGAPSTRALAPIGRCRLRVSHGLLHDALLDSVPRDKLTELHTRAAERAGSAVVTTHDRPPHSASRTTVSPPLTRSAHRTTRRSRPPLRQPARQPKRSRTGSPTSRRRSFSRPRNGCSRAHRQAATGAAAAGVGAGAARERAPDPGARFVRAGTRRRRCCC